MARILNHDSSKSWWTKYFHDLQDRSWITISPEEILHRDVDVIVIHDYDVPSLEEKIETIKSDPALSQLEAVQQNRFVPVSLENVLPGPRMADTIELFTKDFKMEDFNEST